MEQEEGPHLMPHTDGRCEFPNCAHRDAQYIVTVETVALDGKRQAIACRQHIAIVAKALGEEIRNWIREGYDLAEIGDAAEHPQRPRSEVARQTG